MNGNEELQATIAKLIRPGMGILAADESLPTIAKRFLPLGIANTDENRRAYRSLLFTAPDAQEFISGVILFEETLGQRADDGDLLPEELIRRGIVPGIKVDKGTTPMVNAPGDLITGGLDGLPERLRGYKAQGARFAKWREVYGITDRNPTPLGIEANAEALAAYAAICQAEGIVPIVEPEVLIDGDHTMERCDEVIEAVLHAVFHALYRHKVILEYMVLKPSMVLPGKDRLPKATPEQVAAATVKVLRRAVPAAVPGIYFLSGGQRPEEATANLNAMNAQFPNAPWQLSFSYGRALQDPVIQAWAGRMENRLAAQQAFFHRAKMNGLARNGRWSAAMERGD
jgi:fructose-bisphosphate aldolase, class I